MVKLNLFKHFGGGVVTDEPPKGEGFHHCSLEDLYVYNVKQQEVFESKMQSFIWAGLDISLDISVLYQPKISELEKLHQTKGLNYLQVVIIPSLRASGKKCCWSIYTRAIVFNQKRCNPK